jgi:hypothetical protein
VAGCCEHGNEHSVYIKCGDFLDWLKEYWPLGKDTAPRTSLGRQLAHACRNVTCSSRGVTV